MDVSARNRPHGKRINGPEVIQTLPVDRRIVKAQKDANYSDELKMEEQQERQFEEENVYLSCIKMIEVYSWISRLYSTEYPRNLVAYRVSRNFGLENHRRFIFPRGIVRGIELSPKSSQLILDAILVFKPSAAKGSHEKD